MGQFLILFVLYAICASAVLVWSTLLDKRRVLRSPASRCEIEYVAIPQQSLLELAEKFPNLVIFDLHGHRVASGRSEVISCWLPISAVDLPSILKWLPPASRVVFCCRDATEQIDTQSEAILLQLETGSLYFLDDSLPHEANRRWAAGVTPACASRKVWRRTSTKAGGR